MNTKRLLISILVLAVLFTLGLGAVAAQNNPGNGGNGSGYGAGNGYQGGQNPNFAPGGNYGTGLHLNLPPAAVTELPQEVIDLMVAGWLDEQHAYAVYGSVIEQLGALRPFVNIQRSEAQHSSAWETLFARYGITIPDMPTFELPAFASAADACAVGVAAETANFGLYDTMLTVFEPYPDLLYVAQTLRDASEFSHLPAFERCAGW